MKYYSDLTNKLYENEKELLKAESDYKKVQKEKEDKEALRLSERSKQKKILANEVEEAEKKVTEANKLYELAQNRAAEILEKSNKEVSDILEEAQKRVEEAEKAKLDALMKFTKEFGSYKTEYTGSKAVEEFHKSMGRFDRTLKDIINSMFMF